MYRGLGVTYGPTLEQLGAPGADPSACVNGFDEFGQACQDWTPITSDPNATAKALQILYGAPTQQPQNFFAKYSTPILIGSVALLALMVLGPGGRR